MEGWMTVAEAEKQTGIPARSIQRYLAQHGAYIYHRRGHRIYYLADETLPVLIRIRDWYALGWSADRISE